MNRPDNQSPVAANARLCHGGPMCRSIKTLRGAEPPPSQADAQAAALQFVRKISGYRSPSRANQEAFDRAVAEVTAATVELLDNLQPAGAGASGSPAARPAG